MSLHNAALSERADLQTVEAAGASAGTLLTSDSVLCTGFGAVEFSSLHDTANAGNEMKVQNSADDQSWADVTGATVTPDTDADDLVVDVAEIDPKRPYYRAQHVRSGANTATGPIVARRYKSRSIPVPTPAATRVVRVTAD